MKNARINRRLVLVAFLLAVLLGAGGQAVALWQQNSTVTMQVTVSKMPAPTISCRQGSTAFSVDVSWVPKLAGVTGYRVTVLRNNVIDKTNNYGASTTTETIQVRMLSAKAGDTYAVTVVALYGEWQAEPATHGGMKVIGGVLGSGIAATISCS